MTELDAEEGNLAHMALKIGDSAGSDRLINELQMVAKEKREAEDELKRLEQDEADQQAMREQLKTVKLIVAGIVQTGAYFTYAQKRAFLWMLKIQVTAYPVGHDPRIGVTAGKHGDMSLLRLARNGLMYCDNNIKSCV